jgi:hypothetical protein
MTDDAQTILSLLEGMRAGASESGSDAGAAVADALGRLLVDRDRLAARVKELEADLARETARADNLAPYVKLYQATERAEARRLVDEIQERLLGLPGVAGELVCDQILPLVLKLRVALSASDEPPDRTLLAEARVAQLEEERNQWWAHAQRRAETAEARVAELEAALREFGPLCCLVGDETVTLWTNLAGFGAITEKRLRRKLTRWIRRERRKQTMRDLTIRTSNLPRRTPASEEKT